MEREIRRLRAEQESPWSTLLAGAPMPDLRSGSVTTERGHDLERDPVRNWDRDLPLTFETSG
jgi:hypothetical protein